MSRINQRLLRELDIINIKNKKNINFWLDEETLNYLETFAEIVSEKTEKFVSRNTIIDDALRDFVDATKDDLKDLKIDVDKYRKAKSSDPKANFDTIVLPAHEYGFQEEFLNNHRFYYVRIAKKNIDKIKNIAIYIGSPTSAITHYGKIKEFRYVEEKGKYMVYLEGPAIKLEEIVPLGSTHPIKTRTIKYTTLDKLLKATEYKDL